MQYSTEVSVGLTFVSGWGFLFGWFGLVFWLDFLKFYFDFHITLNVLHTISFLGCFFLLLLCFVFFSFLYWALHYGGRLSDCL